MKDYKTNTDWTRNKNSTSIIYMSADGAITEITLESFLAESPCNTVEKFKQIKALSDKLFQDEDILIAKCNRNELPLIKDEIYKSRDKVERVCSKEKKKMLYQVPAILDKFTETQKRRFLLHKVKGLSTRKIATMENVSHLSVYESILAAEKKIDKYFAKYEKNTPKHPNKNDDI